MSRYHSLRYARMNRLSYQAGVGSPLSYSHNQTQMYVTMIHRSALLGYVIHPLLRTGLGPRLIIGYMYEQKLMKQVNKKTFSMRKLVAYRI